MKDDIFEYLSFVAVPILRPAYESEYMNIPASGIHDECSNYVSEIIGSEIAMGKGFGYF